MPAIELARLRKQAAHLMDLIQQPEVFRRAVQDLLELYADHTFKPGHMSTPGMRFPSYRVVPFIQRQLEEEMRQIAGLDATIARSAAAALWQDDHMEARMLAAILLGESAPINADEIFTLLGKWIHTPMDNNLRSKAIDYATRRLRREDSPSMLQGISQWLASPEISYQSAGLIALACLVEESDFQNLPPVFSILEPFVINPPSRIINEMQTMLGSLIKKEPAETAAFIRHSLEPEPTTEAARLLRKVLIIFPEEQQISLRPLAGLRSNPHT